MADFVFVDGAQGEGGGQIVRSALTLSLVTGRALHVEGIRAGRRKPGLMRQHLTAVQAAQAVGCAEVEGAEIGATSLRFTPRTLQGGEHRFSVGTAGSTTLVLQTVLPALLGADTPSTITLQGGTHNPLAPPFEFVERCFLPVLRSMGVEAEITLERAGFFPAGGGEIRARVAPCTSWKELALHERGALQSKSALAYVSALPADIGERELAIVQRKLGIPDQAARVLVVDTPGPGNAVIVGVASQEVEEIAVAFGRLGLPARAVANDVVRQARRYLASDAPVGVHLADQLLLPLALAGRGSFTTLAPSRHTLSNADVISQFLPVRFRFEELAEDRCRVSVST